MELMAGPFGRLAAGLVHLVVQAAGAVLMVVLAWMILKIILSGGSERLGREVLLRFIILGVAVAALSNLGAAVGVLTAVGGAIWTAVATAVQGAG